jgi:hypothetical protein
MQKTTVHYHAPLLPCDIFLHKRIIEIIDCKTHFCGEQGLQHAFRGGCGKADWREIHACVVLQVTWRVEVFLHQTLKVEIGAEFMFNPEPNFLVCFGF